MPLRFATILCHVVLTVTIAASVLTPITFARAGLALLLTAPLLATLPGLLRERRSVLRYVAVLLVVYVGGTSVEVVARAGDTWALSVALLAAALELGLLLALIRRGRPLPSASRE
jgi:hypothetical protein